MSVGHCGIPTSPTGYLIYSGSSRTALASRFTPFLLYKVIGVVACAGVTVVVSGTLERGIGMTQACQAIASP